MLKEISAGTLVKNVRQIKVDFDPIADTSQNQLLNSAGRLVPLIQVARTIIPFADVQFCNICIGKTFLPTIELSFQATQNFIDNDFPVTYDLITIYIGNQHDKDFKVVKSDFLIVSAEQNGNSIILKGELYIDILRSTTIKSYQSMSCIEAIKAVCNDIGLGLVTNIDNTEDSMTWLQCNETYDSFLQKHLLRHLWLGQNGNVIRYFIDPWYRLNVVDVLTEMQVKPLDDELKIDFNTGNAFDEPQKLIFNNNVNGKNTLAAFNDYKLKYSNNAIKTPSSVNIHSMLHNAADSTIESSDTAAEIIQEKSDKMIDAFADYSIRTALQISKYDEQHSNIHQNFFEAATMHDWSQGILDRVMLMLTIPKTLNALYVYKTVNVELYKYGNRYEAPIPENEERAKKNSGDYKQPNANELVLNQRLSGQYIITGITWEFTKSKMLSQIVECQRRMWPMLDIDKLK